MASSYFAVTFDANVEGRIGDADIDAEAQAGAGPDTSPPALHEEAPPAPEIRVAPSREPK